MNYWQLECKMQGLAAELLRRASEEFARHGCHDLDLREFSSLTEEEVKHIVTKYHTENGDPEELDEITNWFTYLPDWILMQVCADLLDG